MAKPLSVSRFVLADHHMRRYVATVPAGTKLEDVLQPTYFVNVLHQLIPGRTLISVLSEDMELFADLLVMDLRQHTAKTRVLTAFWEPGAQKTHRETVFKSAFKEYEINWGGRHHQHRIVHGNNVIESGFNTRELAEQRLKEMKAEAAKK